MMYQMIGVGNALVDTQFGVSDDLLLELALDKGAMTLADAEAQKQLFDKLAQANIESVKQSGGGSGANSMVAFANLGGKAYYHCRVGDDELGRFYLQDLADNGVATNDAFAKMQGTTGSCVVLVSPEGERTMQTYLGASTDINDSNVDFEQLSGADWLYLEGYLAMSPSIAPAITKLRQQAGVHGVNIAVSFADPAVVRFAKEGLLGLLGNGVSAIFCNLEEAQLFTDKKQHKACARALLDYAALVVVTAGAEPTIIAKRGTQKDDEPVFFEITTPKVPVVDTNGAGDNYAGAFLYALNECYDLQLCGQLASQVAACVVQQFGARLLPNEYLAIKQQVLG